MVPPGFAKRENLESPFAIRVLILVRLDVGSPDHLAPFFGVVGDELTKVGRRAPKHDGAKTGIPSLYRGISQGSFDFALSPTSVGSPSRIGHRRRTTAFLKVT